MELTPKRRRPVPSRSDLLRACDVLLDMQVMAESARPPNRMGAMLEFVDGAATFAESVRAYLEETILAEAIVARGEQPHDERKTDPPPAAAETEPAPIEVEAVALAADPCALCGGEGESLQERGGEMGRYPCPLCKGSGSAHVIVDGPAAAVLEP
jgi:hypothetical protein